MIRMMSVNDLLKSGNQEFQIGNSYGYGNVDAWSNWRLALNYGKGLRASDAAKFTYSDGSSMVDPKDWSRLRPYFLGVLYRVYVNDVERWHRVTATRVFRNLVNLGFPGMTAAKQPATVCPKCNGAGKDPQNNNWRCDNCGGTGHMRDTLRISWDLNLPAFRLDVP